MSRSQKLNNEENGKIPRDASAKGLESAIQCTSATISSRYDQSNPSTSKSCRPMLTTQSDGSIIKSPDQAGLKQKLVNKVKSWGSKGIHSNDSASLPKSDANLATITLDLETLNLASDTSDDTMYRSDLVKAKDSLEHILGHKSDKAVSGDVSNSKSPPYCSPSCDTNISPELPASDPFLGGSSGIDHTSRVLAWDPWNRLARKSKRENKRRKPEKSPHLSRDSYRNGSPQRRCKDHTGGNESRIFTSDLASTENSNIAPDYEESYEYQPYRHNRKSVEFVNEVVVVYFTGDEVVAKSTEPLKKELDQQNRNKEMRRGHIPCTMMGKKQRGSENYMAAWFKK